MQLKYSLQTHVCINFHQLHMSSLLAMSMSCVWEHVLYLGELVCDFVEC